MIEPSMMILIGILAIVIIFLCVCLLIIKFGIWFLSEGIAKGIKKSGLISKKK